MMSDQFANRLGVAEAVRRSVRFLVPPPDMQPSVWGEQNIQIPVGNAIPGPISFKNAPYQRGMIDVIKEPGCNRVSYMLAAQTGKTTIMQTIMAYFIAHEPRSQIVCMPTQGDSQTFLETKLRPMIDANPSISGVMAKQRGREGVNNSRIMSYVGGWMMMSWAGSPKTLRGRSAPVTLADEVDGYEDTAEGNPVQLLAQRAATFGDQRLMIESSTPTVKGASNIEAAFLQGDQRRYWVPCPDCGEHQVMKWDYVTWDGKDEKDGYEHKPETAAYACAHCGSLWDDGLRVAAVRNGEWRAEKPFRGHASFHLPELCSTFRKMRDIVQSYLDKIAVGDEQTFVNVSLAETYEKTGEAPDWQRLYSRRLTYARNSVPDGGLFLTAAVDVQKDRLECEILAWGRRHRSWSVDYRVWMGDTADLESANSPWKQLDALLNESWQHHQGAPMRIRALAVDSGYQTQTVYTWVRKHPSSRVMATKGQDSASTLLGQPRAVDVNLGGKKISRGLKLWTIGTDIAKSELYGWLRQDAHPDMELPVGWSEWPEYEEEYFKQLTAEQVVTSKVRGYTRYAWQKTRARNESIDIRVMNRAAASMCGIDRWREENWLDLERELTPVESSPAQAKEESPRQERRRSRWL